MCRINFTNKYNLTKDDNNVKFYPSELSSSRPENLHNYIYIVLGL